ncbi:hypothetical protein HAU32_07850 [Weissella confusa]|uniref:N-acetyltransferase n=1 Tax=Weissella fermenti TaxID=2987699 RepID=A0ABT6D0H8_9LACO|nr:MULTISPECIES: hypothetical protein [Weissella]MBJ7688885.1 hypothetical protein [Weissella confusa]MDF9298752.1 hypothetical protein [Weissella sp. BK2]
MVNSKNRDIIRQIRFSDLDVNNNFFDSLRADYPNFDNWFENHADSPAFIINNQTELKAFIYVKQEAGEPIDLSAGESMDGTARFKIGTFKINSTGTILGDKMLSYVLRRMVEGGSNAEEVYVTVFAEKQEKLVRLFERFGFIYQGKKENGESVYVKRFKQLVGEPYKDFPMVNLTGTQRIFNLGIYPEFHDLFFSEGHSMNEVTKVADEAVSNTVTKTYLNMMHSMDESGISKGDILTVYRTGGNYAGVITSVATVVDYKRISDFATFDEYKKFIGAGTVFTDQQITNFWKTKKFPFMVKFVYDYSVSIPRPNLDWLRKNLKIEPEPYWGFFELNKQQFSQIIGKGGDRDGRFVIY